MTATKEKTNSFSYTEDGQVFCDQCGSKVCKVPSPHWNRMQRLIARGGKPWTDTLTLGSTMTHLATCSACRRQR